MFRPRPPARVLIPFFLFAGCTSVPELPPVTEMHPSHPDAQSALIADRPTILDAMAMDAVVEPEAGMETMDHSQHNMGMGMDSEENESPDAAQAAEMDHSQHQMDMGDEQEEPPAEDDGEDDNGESDHGGDHDS